MLVLESGTVFLGFAPEQNCQNCGNKTRSMIKGEYFKQSVLGIPLGSVIINHAIVQCPVCEYQSERLAIGGTLNFDRHKNMVKLLEMLEAGKEFTRLVVRRLDSRDKASLLRRLNLIGAHSFAKFVFEE